MDEPTRRAWSRPELIVIVRSGPEEAVLAVCKTIGTMGTGYTHAVCSVDGARCNLDYSS